MRYTNSHLEDWIENLYKKIDITEPEQINFERIAEALDIRLSFKPVTSFALKHSGIYNICLDSRKSRTEQWYDFAHEFCHIYRHEGDKKTMPATWTDYLEWQSNYFTYHFCIPTFMLRNINLSYIQSHAIENVAWLFKVSPSFAKKRLSIYYRKLTQHLFNQSVTGNLCTPLL
ncbi:ImmA/IrrE family metallo-endopeptidase [Bacillus inaquosorum]|uniref:ImmA/IrrE family metallo-endopeptidase n=1 Tax=Bacillus inaquosorum TaxID=483913 RepID=UPI00228034B1|nr:ImmA/IrrE family metallo-endopeptidase [Bacillus inaquosorum]MCY7965011.1 ImmA/IrrE family metallo-endopeptidase [Bacillus inaquosorum]